MLLARGDAVRQRDARAAARRSLAAGRARVVAVGRDAAQARRARRRACPGIRTEVCDLTDESAVRALAERVHDAVGPVDGILHLVGGWRGGGGLAGQSDEDYRFLERSFTALRHVSRAFDDDLRASDRRAPRDRVVDRGRASARGRRELRGRQGRERGVDARGRAGLREGRAGCRSPARAPQPSSSG